MLTFGHLRSSLRESEGSVSAKENCTLCDIKVLYVCRPGEMSGNSLRWLRTEAAMLLG